jgi:phytoene synthase
VPSAAELVEAYAVCRAIAKREAKNFYYGFLALPAHKRDAMCAVYAFMRRADDIADDESVTLEQRRIEMQRWLASWRGEASEEPQDVPVFLAVRDVQARFGVSGDLLEQLIQGTTMDLDPEPPVGVRRIHVGGRLMDQYETMEALERYCYLVASVVGLTTIRIFGFTDPKANEYAEQLGLAFQLTNILRDVKEDAERGRIYLPESLLSKHGVTAAEVLAASSDGKASQNMRIVLAVLGAHAEVLYQAEERLIPLLDADSRAAMRVLVRIYHLLLIRMERGGYPVFQERVSVPTARKLLVLAGGLASSLLARRRDGTQAA